MNAYFLWLGTPLPFVAKLSVMSALHHGFDVTLFSDRPQNLDERIKQVAYTDILSDISVADVRQSGKPCYAGFSDLFRYKLLKENTGWWFDCDTVILKNVDQFSTLVSDKVVTVGFESENGLNGAVLYCNSSNHAQRLYTDAIKIAENDFPWGAIGPDLITKHYLQNDQSNILKVEKNIFYPLSYREFDKVYRKEQLGHLNNQVKDSFCLTLWSSFLRQSGLAYMAPPTGSFLHQLSSELYVSFENTDDSCVDQQMRLWKASRDMQNKRVLFKRLLSIG